MPARLGVVRRPERNRRAADRDGARVGLDVTRQDLHKRRLAGPVLTDECVYLTGGHDEIHSMQHFDADIRLPYPADFDLEPPEGSGEDDRFAGTDPAPPCSSAIPPMLPLSSRGQRER